MAVKELVDPNTYRADWIDPTKLEEEAKKKGMISGTKFREIETSLKNANDTITRTQTYLGTDDLNNLPTLSGKTLAQLLADSNQLGELSDTLKNNFNLTDLTE
ncbi:21_t:CDS:1 [Paraglomus occultum]|uniref:21_t:CDS:1 n=1 Tax=Paraglomus occultum TaxID=144539 RepID=A0A9N9GPB1_9GLOM|nr:21_t:CDS:1 [Paraglomus occultum]